jgi:hypothetical protein
MVAMRVRRTRAPCWRCAQQTKSTLRKSILAVTAIAILAIAFSLPAGAARKQVRSRSEAPARPDSSSLDGRVLGYPRTCGSTTFVYSSTGGTMGPYCH